MLTMVFLWAWMANQIVQSNFILWIKYGFGREDQFLYLMVGVVRTLIRRCRAYVCACSV